MLNSTKDSSGAFRLLLLIAIRRSVLIYFVLIHLLLILITGINYAIKTLLDVDNR